MHAQEIKEQRNPYKTDQTATKKDLFDGFKN